MHWFRKARYAVALLVISLTGIGFATQIGEHSTQYVVTVYLISRIVYRDRGYRVCRPLISRVAPVICD